MNKIFKVVWSKTKECYVVVSEVAKNNGGKKKALSTVFAALVAVGAMMPGQVDAVSYDAGGGTASGDTSIAIGGGFGATQDGPKANSKFSIAIGQEANATGNASIAMGHLAKTSGEESAIAIGNETEALSKDTTAVGSGSKSQGEKAAAFGFQSKALASYATALGSGALSQAEDSQAIGRQAETSTSSFRGIAIGTLAKVDGKYGVAVGAQSKATAESAVAVGYNTQATGYQSAAVGPLSKATNRKSIALGVSNTASGVASVATGAANTASGDYAAAYGAGNTASSEGSFAAGYKATATNKGSVAIGQYVNAEVGGTSTNPSVTSKNNGDYSTAVGYNSITSGENSAAYGAGAQATNKNATAVGNASIASGENSSAYGAGAQATNKKATAVGNASVASGENSSAFGYNNTVTGDSSTALGTGNVIDNGGKSVSSAVAVGHENKASGVGAIAIGKTNTSKVDDTITMGTSNTANTAGGIAIGNNNTADSTAGGGSSAGNIQIAIGRDNQAKNEDTIAIGRENTADKRLAMAIGNRTEATGIGAVAIGSNGAGQKSISSGSFSVALGTGTNSTGTASTALGGKSQATADSATAVGRESNASAESATALGYKAAASIKDGVALGSESKTTVDAGQVGYNPAAGRTNKYDNLTDNKNNVLTSNRAAVAIGDDDAHITRQLTGLAAGNKDTDAVNVAQLKAVNLKYAGNSGDSDVRLENGTLNIKGEGLLSTSADATGIKIEAKIGQITTNNDGKAVAPSTNGIATTDNVTQAINNSGWKVTSSNNGGTVTGTTTEKVSPGDKVTFSAGKNIVLDQNGKQFTYSLSDTVALTNAGSLTVGGTKVNNGGVTITAPTGGTTTNVTLTQSGLDNGGNKIVNVKDGDVSATSKDAVNGSQLHAVKAAERHIAPTTAGHEYTVDSNGDVTMTYLDGNNNAVANEKAVIKGIAKQDLSNINDAGKTVITGLGTIVKAGDNINVSESSDATTGQKTYTVNAVTPAVYTKADGTKVYKRPDGTFTTNSNLAAGNNVDKGDVITSFMDGNGNTTGGNMVINNVGSAIDKTGTSTGNTFLTKLNTAATNTPNAAVNVRDLKTTSDAIIDKGLRFDANEGNEKTNKLGSKVTVQGSGAVSSGKAFADEYNTANIRTNISQNNGDTVINVGLAKALKDINSVSNGSSSITLNSNPGGTGNTPAVSITGGNVDVGGNNITNLKSGGDTDSNAANIGDVKKIASDTDTHIKPGTYTVAADKTVTMTYVNGKGETVKANGQDVVAKIDLSGLPTGGTSSTEKVQKAADANGDKNIADVNPKAGDTFGAADATYEVSVSRNAVKDAAREAVTVNNGGTTKADGSYTADSNNPISVTPTKDDNNHNTSYAVTFDGNKAAKQIPLTYKATNGTTTSAAQTVTLDKGLNFTGGDYTTASIGADGKVTFDVNLGTAPTVTDGKPGVPGQAGATGKDGIATVKTVVDTINNSGWKANAKANGGKLDGTATATVVKPGNTVNYAAGKNLIVNQELEKDASNALTGNQTYTYSLNKDIDLTKDGSLTVGDTTVNNGGITIKAPTPAAGTTATTTDVKLTNTGLDNGGNKIVNVKAGDVSATSTDAVNGSQLHAVKAAERHIKPDTYAVDGNGKVTMKYVDGDNQDVTGEAVITGIAKQDLSNINDAGKKVITGLGSIVEAGDNVTVTSTENATTGQKTYTVNAVTPVVYTTPSGDKLTKKSDGKFYKADGSEYTGGDIIASFENPNANSIPAGKNSTTDGGMIVNNIGSAIKTQNPTMPAGQTATYLDKLKAAADAGSNVKNAAVNVSDLHNTAEALKSNELHIRPTVTNRTGETVNQNAGGTAESYKYDAATQSVTLKYNDGTGAGVTGTEAKIDLSDLANQITSGYTFKTNATENGGKVVNDASTPAAETAVANGGVVNYAAGKNLTVKQDIEKDGTGAATGKQTYTYALADEIGIGEKGQPGVAGKDGVDGKIGVNGKDGSSVVINGKDGSIGMTGPQGQNGKDGINGRDGANISMTSAKGEQVLINRDPAHSADTDKAERIVYVPKDASGNPIKDANGKNIVREVATMDDGLKFTGNNTTIENKQKLGSLVKVQGEGTKEGTTVINPATGEKEIVLSDGTTKFESAKDNIAVVADGTNTLTVKLNKNLKGLDSVQTKTVELGDHTTPGGTTNITYNSGDKRIEYTTPGAAGTPETKKVATTDDIWTIQGNGTDVAPVNGKVNVKAGENILITTPTTADGSMTINAVTPAVYTDKDGNKLTKDKDGKFHKDDGTEVAAADVITSIQDAAGHTTGGNSIVNNVGSAINNHATPGVTSPTYLDKLDAAAGDTKTQNAAVNVTDLKNTADGLTNKGLKFDANEGGVKTNKLGSTVTVQGSGALTAGKAYADEYNTANIRTKIDQDSDGNTTINVGLAKALKEINSISNGNSSITLNSNPGGTGNTPAVSITGGNLSMGNNKIVNLAPGTNDTDAVNYSQIKGLRTEVKQGANVTVSKTQGTDGHDIYTISAAATGGTASSWNIKSSADTANGGATATGHNANAVNISDQKTVEMVAGKNLTVKQDTTTDGAKVELALSDNIVAGKDGVNGKDGSVGATGKDGSSVVINGADGSIGMTGPKGQDGKDGINGRDGANISMTSAKGEQVLVNRDPAHSADTDKAERIVYVPKDASGNPIQDANGKNIVREVATMDDGMKYAGDDAQGTDKSKVIAKKLNQTLDIIGGADKDKLTDNNIGVNNDGNGKLKVQLSKEITGLTSVQIGGNTIKTDGDHITITSPDTTPSATPGATVTHKVANLSDEMHIKDTEYTVGSDKKVRLTYVDGNGNPVNNKTAVINLSGLPVGDKDTDMRIKEGTYTAKNGTVTLETVNKDGSTANKDVVIKGINTNQYKAGDNVTFTQDGIDANGNPIYKINADLSGASSIESVVKKSLTGDTNIAEISVADGKATGDKNAKYEVSVSKNAVKDAAREAVEVTGSGVIKVTADNTTTPHKTTYDVAYDPDKAAEVTKISYKSSTSPDAGSQGPKKVSLKDGFDFKSTGGNVKITTDNAGGIDFNVDLSGIHGVSQNIAVGGNVDPTSLTGTDTVTKGTRFDAGNNLVVKRTALNDTGLDHAISYELNKDLQGINSIRNANNGPVMNFNAGDIAISGGNLSMGDGTHNNKIVNVAPGTDKSDVATVGQLTKVVSSNGTVTIAPVYKDQDGAPVYDLSVTGVPGADPRVDQLAEEIGRVGAQGAALSALKPIQYDPLEPTQIMAGYGNYRGNSALALGVAHYKNESTLIHGGVSWAGGSSHMMANAGVTWKVGNRDSEAAVADRYRKGPISSAYAMQQEMAAMKAQNAGLKGEVSDLKAENEQMKAQIAAMMAKLGL